MNRLSRGMVRYGFAFVLLIGLTGCGPAESTAVSSAPDAPAKVYRWKLITTWPKNLPGLGTAPERLARQLKVMSNGRLDIRVYGAGELVGAFEVFDAVSQGTAEMGHGSAYYLSLIHI